MSNLSSFRNSLPFLSTILLFITVAGCGNQAENSDILFEQGNLAATAGDMETAVRHFTAALQKSPDRSDITYERGRAYEALGFLEKAIADYQACLQQEPNFEGAINNTGVCYAKLQQHDAAIKQFTKLIEQAPSNVLALRNRGLCYHDTEQFESALADYNTALEFDSSDPETWFQRGNVYLENDEDQKAFDDYSEAVRIAPEFSKAWMNRGVALFSLNRPEEGMQDLTKASELDENIIIPDLNWANVTKRSEAPLQNQDTERTAGTAGSSARDAAMKAGWDQAQADGKTILVNKQYSTPTVQTAVPNQLCGILQTERAGQKFSVYVGVLYDGSEGIQIPAAPTAPGAKRSLMVLKFDPLKNQFTEHRFIENWQPTKADIAAATVEAKLP